MLLHKTLNFVVCRFDEIYAPCSELCVEQSHLFPVDKHK